MFKIAVDCMGGDNSPNAQVKGVCQFIESMKGADVEFVLFGDAQKIKEMVEDNYEHCISRIHFIESASVVTGELHPKESTKLRDSSMVMAVDYLATNNCDAVMSCGNTGAYFATCTVKLKRLERIKPAITANIPNLGGWTTFLDAGASITCSAGEYLDMALMGAIYHSCVHNVDMPSVGLLNVGSESHKGTKELQDADKAIRNSPPKCFIYKGFAEGNDLNSGAFDVVVADGFSGNISVKVMAGVGKLISNVLMRAFNNANFIKRGLTGLLLKFVKKK